MTEADGRERVAAWLAAERQGHDVEAEAAFGVLWRSVPRVEPSADLEGRIWRATRRIRMRARALLALRLAAGASAAVVLSAASLYLASGLFVSLSIRVLSRLFHWLVRGFVWVVLAFSEGLDLWSLLAEAGRVISSAVFTPEAATALVIIELAGALAFYILNRVLAREKETSP